MKKTKKKTFREITEEWPIFKRGQHYIQIARCANVGYSTITSAKTRGCGVRTAEAITSAMIKLGHVGKDTTAADLFPENKKIN